MMNTKISNLVLFLCSILLSASSFSNEAEDYSLSSPRNTVQTHLKFLQEETYEPEIAAKPFELGGENAESLAIKLKQVLDGKGYEIVLENISNNKNYFDSSNNKHRYIVDSHLPKVYLEKVGKKWLYSEKTLKAIPALHKEVFPFGTDKLVNLLPQNAHKKFFGLELWQHLGILILVILSFIVHKILTWVFDKLLLRLSMRFINRDLTEKYIHPVARPLSLFIVTLILFTLFPILQLPIKVSKYIIIAFKVITPFYAILVFYYLVDVVSYYFQKFADRTDSTLDDQLVPLVRRALKVFVVITGGLFILQNLDYNITALLAGISIGGLAFALAAQDTIKNLFGSMMIFVDRPFGVGDWIVSSDVDGTVEEVGFRSTRVRTFHNSVISIPNGKLADQAIDNMGARAYRRFKTNLALTYDTPPELIEAFVKGLKKIVEEHPNTRKDYYEIHMNDMADFSLNVLFYIFFSVSNWSDELKARQEVILSIIRLADKLGVRFAFPTQTLHVENFPEKKSLTPEYSFKPGELDDKLK